MRYLQLLLITQVYLLLFGCGYQLYKKTNTVKQTINPTIGSVMVVDYDSHVPDAFRTQVRILAKEMGFVVKNNNQENPPKHQYNLSFQWQRNGFQSLPPGNFVVSLIVQARYSVLTPDSKDEQQLYFAPNRLFTLHTEVWNINYIQSQTDTQNSAQYAFAAENELFIRITDQTLLQKLKIHLRRFITKTKDYTLYSYLKQQQKQ